MWIDNLDGNYITLIKTKTHLWFIIFYIKGVESLHFKIETCIFFINKKVYLNEFKRYSNPIYKDRTKCTSNRSPKVNVQPGVCKFNCKVENLT